MISTDKDVSNKAHFKLSCTTITPENIASQSTHRLWSADEMNVELNVVVDALEIMASSLEYSKVG